MALIHMIEDGYPELWKGWLAKLEQYRKAHGLPAEWITEGKWRLVEGSTDDQDSHY
jgi:hypothetical protein